MEATSGKSGNLRFEYRQEIGRYLDKKIYTIITYYMNVKVIKMDNFLKSTLCIVFTVFFALTGCVTTEQKVYAAERGFEIGKLMLLSNGQVHEPQIHHLHSAIYQNGLMSVSGIPFEVWLDVNLNSMTRIQFSDIFQIMIEGKDGRIVTPHYRTHIYRDGLRVIGISGESFFDGVASISLPEETGIYLLYVDVNWSRNEKEFTRLRYVFKIYGSLTEYLQNVTFFSEGKMGQENKSVHDFDVNLICEYYSHFDRQNPGTPEITKKALSFIENIDALSELSQIADIGCGTGGQTITLAQHTTANIIGIDLAPIMIEKFNKNMIENNLQKRVQGVVGSMDNLSFKNEELDMILSEGAIYNIGFERGLKEWNKYIKKDGYIIVSDASWFTEDRPSEITDFWMGAYAEIDTIPNCMSKMQKAGYIPIASFIVPEYCWTDNFYGSHISFQDIFLKKYAGNKAVEEFIAYERYEAQMYNKYKKYYGYVFYIGKKI